MDDAKVNTDEQTSITEDSEPVKTIDDITAMLDEQSSTEDNNADGTANSAEEVPTVEALQREIETLRNDYSKIVDAMGRMVTMYGAKIGDNSKPQGVEAFKGASKVEQTFPDSITVDGVIPLSEIKLG